MILAGLLLGAVVFASWPDGTTRAAGLPSGTSQPKAPTTADARRPAAARVAVAPAPELSPDVTAAEMGPVRVLAAVEPDAVATEEFDPADGPAPVPSQTELGDDYVQESPEELGAEPLPGADLTQAAPPVAG